MIISPCFGYRSQTVGGGPHSLEEMLLGGTILQISSPVEALTHGSVWSWERLCVLCATRNSSPGFCMSVFFRLNYTFNNFDWWYKGTFLNAGLPSFLMSFRDLFWVFCFMGDCCYPIFDTFHLRNNLNLLYGCIQSMLHQLKAPILMLTLQAHVMFGLRTKDRIWRKRQTMRSWKTI